MTSYKKNKGRLRLISIIIFLLSLSVFFNQILIKKSFAGGNGTLACKGVYTSNPIIYALYLKARGGAIGENDVITYIKIVNPAEYMHDRYNQFLWSKLFSKDKLRLAKLVDYINSVKCFKENIKAGIDGYSIKKRGFYLTYRNMNEIIKDGMKTHRNIDFIKTKNGNIYYLFRPLTIVHQNAGDFNFLGISQKKAENFIDKRTGTFGHIKKSVYLEYYFVPLSAKHNVLTVKILSVKVYNNKRENLLLGTIK